MTQVTGSNVITSFFEETTFGTTPATPDAKLFYNESFELAKKQNLIQSKMRTGTRGKARPMRGNITVDGSSKFELNAENTGIIFKHLMGSVTHSGTGPYTHVYKIGKLPTSLGAIMDLSSDMTGNRYLVYKGIRINDATFDLSPEGACNVTISMNASDAVLSATNPDNTPTDTGAVSFSGFEATILENGAAIGNVKSGSIKIANALGTDKYAFGSGGKRRSIPEGSAEVTGSLTVFFEDDTLLNKALSSTDTSIKVTYSRGTGDGSAGNESVELFMTNVTLPPVTPGVSGDGGLEVTFELGGYKVGTDLGLQITVKNAIATY